jgi:dihydrofolate reductase
MRKITVLSMITLDGVMQAPGGRDEDMSNDFQYGGWTAAFADQAYGETMQKELQPSDYLLGRKTFDIWEKYWPNHGDFWPAINSGTKYVLSASRNHSDWQNSEFVKTVDDIEKIKLSEGADIQVWGSGELVKLLFENDLVDEIRLKIYPILLGKGKKLFGDGAIPAAFELTESTVTSKGVVIAAYRRNGDVKTGTVEV